MASWVNNFEIYSNLYVNVPSFEISAINSKKRDKRLLNNILHTTSFNVLRRMLINYLVGGTIRILQEENDNYRTCAIIHTSSQKLLHEWQESLIDNLLSELKESINSKQDDIKQMITTSYEELKASVSDIPNYSEVEKKVIDFVRRDYIDIVKVNSDTDVYAHINQGTGQLRLDNLFNIFIGGNVLDRGLTFDNLIAFYYGREVRQFQEDTVLQHSRMYGARAIKDLAVTRFYTSQYIYDALVNIHQFDAALWNDFEKNGQQDIVFLEKVKNGNVRPCAPNKILISKTRTIKPFARFLPIKFTTKSNTHISNTVNEIEKILGNNSGGNFNNPFLLDTSIAFEIIDKIKSTYTSIDGEEDTDWDEIMKSIINRINNTIDQNNSKGKIYCIVRTDRNVSRYKNSSTTLSDAPEDGQKDSPLAKSVAKEIPCLLLLKQNGKKEKEWKDAAFWWPVLIVPENAKPAIFATETTNDEE